MSQLEQELSHIDISGCLNTVDFETTHNGKKVDVILSYAPWNNGNIDTHSLLLLIKDQIVRKFIITYQEVLKHYSRKDKIEADKDLYAKAIRKITSSTAKGKLGELLLYIFIELFFKAPKILSKLSSLDDPECHVKGADAVHAQFVDGNLVLYLGEAKLWKEYSGACGDAVKSIETTLQDYKVEFDLIESYIDFPNMTEDFETEIINILHPYENPDTPPIIHTPCFIGFESSICKDIKSEEHYISKYKGAAQQRINTFYDKAIKVLDIDKITLILLPFESVDDFTDQFVSVLGIT